MGVVADGKRRPLERPKRKKLFHLAPTGTVLPGRGPENQSKHTQRLAALSRCRGEVKYGGFFMSKQDVIEVQGGREGSAPQCHIPR